jgi:radical SAM protein with 4Fe4S-binding SPASM domain
MSRLKKTVKKRFPAIYGALKKAKGRKNDLFYDPFFNRFFPTPGLDKVHVAVEITNKCNLRCIQCLYQGGAGSTYERKTGYMDWELYRGLINQLSVANCPSILHNADGEATLHKEFLKFLRHACSSKIKHIHFNTNGMLWDRQFIDEFVTFYRGSVYFSLDGFKESHERIRKGSKYDVVVPTIEYLLEARARTNADFVVGSSFCNYDQPEGERERFVEYWLPKVDVVSLCETYDADTRIISKRMNVSPSAKRLMCRIPWTCLEVAWNGDVIPCSTLIAHATDRDKGVMGNVTQEPLQKIWFGDRMKTFRELHLRFDFKGSFCKKCERWNVWEDFPAEFVGDTIVTSNGVFKTYHNKRARAMFGL